MKYLSKTYKYLMVVSILVILSSCSSYSDCEGPATKNKVKDWHECYGEYVIDGISYKGNFRFGKFHDDGLLEISEDKSNGGIIFYEGEFNEGEKQGNGFAKYSSKHLYLKSYDGEWKNDKFDGHGVAEIQVSMADYDGEGVYEGQFRNGEIHGEGVLNSTTSSGDTFQYKGASKNSKYHGKGTTIKTYSSGKVVKYTGDFVSGKKEGKGVLTIDNYYSYEGDFKNNKYHGQGTEINKDEFTYVGQFIDNKRDREGVYTSKNKEFVMKGTFKADNFSKGFIEHDNMKINGNFAVLDLPKPKGVDSITRYKPGTFTNHGAKYTSEMTIFFDDGRIFKGQLNDDFSLKKGTLEYLEGDVYEGEFKNNLKHGAGRYESINGDINDGVFENDTFIGKVQNQPTKKVIQDTSKDNQIKE